MSITTTLRIENDRLSLVPTLKRLDGVQMRVLRQGTTAPGSEEFPFVIEHADRAELETAFRADETVASYEVVNWSDDAGVYYISHTPETKLISPIVTDVNGFLVNTETCDTGWLVHALLPDRDALDTIWTYARENDIALDIIDIHGTDEAADEPSYGLTDEQRAALRVAYDAGYFNEPRDVALDDVAERLDLSPSATSGRLRRGMRNILAATVAERTREH